MSKHNRHPDCIEALPVDSCHWPGCEDGEPPDGRMCYHRECPVCPHPLQVHDGIGCTDINVGDPSQPCPCMVSQAMPNSPLVVNAP